jgi:dTDP-4-dehydrorhamnose reductase
MNILVFGKDGQLGKAFNAVFDASKLVELHSITYVGRAECDLINSDAITELLNQMMPDLIINTAAYTAVDKAETEVDLAYAINAKAPEIMAQYAVKNDVMLLHYSTDYVFDGSKDGFYVEDDQRNPLSIYGKSKAAGEQVIEDVFINRPAQSNAQYAILRASWIYGDGGNFIRTILRLAKECEEIRIISDQHSVPTSSEWLAGVSLDLVLGEDGQFRYFPSGIYHAVPSGQTTWHGLASVAIQSAIEAGIHLKTKPKAIKPILAIEYTLPAPRPMNSRMATDKLRRALTRAGPANASLNAYSIYNKSRTVTEFPAWEGMVREYVGELVVTGMI